MSSEWQKIAVFIFVFGFSAAAYSLDDERHFQKGDSAYIHSVIGLKLRDKPLITGTVLVNMPYGARVKITRVLPPDRLLTVDNITGYWIGVKYKNRMGYTFSGFISRLPAPQKDLKIGLEGFRSKLTAASITHTVRDEIKKSGDRKTTIVFSDANVLDALLVLRKLVAVPNHLKLPPISSSEKMEVSDRKDRNEFYGRTLSVVRKDGKIKRLSYQYIYEGGTQRASIKPVGPKSVQLYIENNVD